MTAPQSNNSPRSPQVDDSVRVESNTIDPHDDIQRGASINWPGALAVLIIVLATAIVFWPALRGEFTIRDDDHTVSQNPDLKPPSIGGVLRYWKRPSWGLYAPVTYTVWSGVALLSPPPSLPNQPYQLNPTTFHAANLIVHALGAVVAYFVLRRLFNHVWAACVGALLIALHPVQVDAVAWVSGLKDVLAALFALLAIWQYLLSADETLDDSDRKVHYALCLIATLTAVLSKVSASMLPGILLVIDWQLLRRCWRQIGRNVIPVLIVCLPAMIIGRIAQSPESRIDLAYRPILALFTFSFYVMKLIWPIALAPDYGLPPQVAIRVNWIRACWIIPAIVAITLWLVRRRRPELVAGALIFLVCIFPVIGFFAFIYQLDSTVADHYLYLAMFGVSVAAAGTLARFGSHRIPWAIAAVALVALGALTFRQSGHWQNTFTLFTHNARVTPTNWRPQNHIGLALLEQKKPADAETHFRASIALEKTHVNVGNLAAARLAQGDVRGAIDQMNAAAALDPTLATYQVQLADLYLRSERPADAEAAAQRALELKPDDPNAPLLLAEARRRQGKR